MKGERLDLPLTIARLARSAQPVTPLASPWLRLARWATASTAALALVSVAIFGLRPDAAAQLMNGWFVARATATLVIVAAAAIVSFSMSVPGNEPSRLVRALPWAASITWAAILVGPIAATPSPLDVLHQVTAHPACVLLIVAITILPGAILVRMLRDAAPLQTRRTAGLAGLASLAVGALGTQFVCTNDAAAHQLLWHFTPVVLLTVASLAIGPSLIPLNRRVQHGCGVQRHDSRERFV